MPDKTIKKLYSSIRPQWRVCFISAMVFGLIAHIYKLTNWLPNWDSLVFRYDGQNMLHLGRWFLPVATAFTSFYDLPFLNGFVAILFYALGAVCICRALEVKGRVTAALIGALVTTFPVVTSTLMYNYVADGYAIAFFLACVGGMCLVADRPGYIISAIAIALSAGIYQAYITVAVMIVLCHLILELIYNPIDVKAFLKKAFFALLFGAIGMALYYGILKALLLVTGTELIDYQGINDAGLGGMDLLASLYVTKETFIQYFFDFSLGLNAFPVINILIFTVIIVFYIKDAIAGGVLKSPIKLLLIIILTTALTFGGTALAFVNPSVDYHTLMHMGYSVFYIFLMLLYERGTSATRKEIIVRRWAVIALSLALVFNQVVIANVCYHKAQMSYEKSMGVLHRMVDRIDQIPESALCEEMVVIGALEDSQAYYAILPPEITGVSDGYILRADDEVVGQSVITSAINDYYGRSYRFLSGNKKSDFLADSRVAQLPYWPATGSVAVIDNVIVIKLGAESEAD